MENITIAPAVIQQESNDMLKYLKDRNLLLAQVVHELRAALAAAQAEIAVLKAPENPPADQKEDA